MLRTYLGDHPEVSSELKSLLADRLGEQGSAIDAQSITDEVLISRLQTDPAFRSDALRLMVNRGYITEQQAQIWAQTLAVNRGAECRGRATVRALPSSSMRQAEISGDSVSAGTIPTGAVSGGAVSFPASTRTAAGPDGCAANSDWQPKHPRRAVPTGRHLFPGLRVPAKATQQTAEHCRADSADTQHGSAEKPVSRPSLYSRSLSSLRS